jgi:hypothetical protein
MTARPAVAAAAVTGRLLMVAAAAVTGRAVMVAACHWEWRSPRIAIASATIAS